MSPTSNQSRCAQCGRVFSAHASYCPRCGRSVKGAATTVVMASPPAVRLDQVTRPPEQRPLPAAPKKKGGGCGGCGCLVMVLLVAAGIGSFYRSSSHVTRRPMPVLPSPPANIRPPRAPDFRSPPMPLMGPMSGSTVWMQSVEVDAVDASGRPGFRLHGRVHSVQGARIIIAAYLQRSDGVAIHGTDPMYRDETNAAGVAMSLTMPQNDLDFTLFLPRHAIGLASPAQPLWIRPALFDAGSGYNFNNGVPMQFWPNAVKMPSR